MRKESAFETSFREQSDAVVSGPMVGGPESQEIQDEFGLSIDPDDAVEMLSVGMIRSFLTKKGIAL